MSLFLYKSWFSKISLNIHKNIHIKDILIKYEIFWIMRIFLNKLFIFVPFLNCPAPMDDHPCLFVSFLGVPPTRSGSSWRWCWCTRQCRRGGSCGSKSPCKPFMWIIRNGQDSRAIISRKLHWFIKKNWEKKIASK